MLHGQGKGPDLEEDQEGRVLGLNVIVLSCEGRRLMNV